MSTTRKIVAASLATLLFAGFAGSADAATWAQKHPRRHQVNQRLDRQNHRINQERREGEISRSQAANLHTEDHQVRQEERDMASQNGGHITRQEQRTLNQQENGVSQQIGQ